MKFVNNYLSEWKDEAIEVIIQNGLNNDLFLNSVNVDAKKELDISKVDILISSDQVLVKLLSNVYEDISSLGGKFQFFVCKLKCGRTASIKEQMKTVLWMLWAGLSICVNHPLVGLKENIGEYIWKNGCEMVIINISTAIKSLPPELDPKINDIQNHLIDLLTRMETLLFHSMLIMISRVQKSPSVSRDNKVTFYYISFISTVLGMLQKYYYEIDEGSTHQDTTAKAAEFYRFATLVWPRYGKPFQHLAQYYHSRKLLLESVYNYVRSFLCLTAEDRFSVAKEDFGVVYDRLEEDYIQYKNKIFKSKEYKLVDLFKGDLIEVILINYAKKDHLFILKDKEVLKKVENYRDSFVKMSSKYPIINNDQRAESFFNCFQASFLLLNAKIIMKYNVDSCDLLLDDMIRALEFLSMHHSNYFFKMESSLEQYAVIVLYSLEMAFIDIRHDVKSACTKQCIVLCINTMMGLCRIFVKLLVSDPNITEAFQISVFKYIALIFRALSFCVNHADFIVLFNSMLPRGDQFLFVDLYKFLFKVDLSNISVISYLPEFKLLSNSVFMVNPSSPVWNEFTIFDKTPTPKLHYIKYILTTLTSILLNSLVFFKITEFCCRFEPKIYINYQSSESSLKYRDIMLSFGGIFDHRLMVYLYNYILNMNKKENVTISYVQYFIPDTNTFLKKKNHIMSSPIWNDFQFIVPILVVREIIGIRGGKRGSDKKGKQVAARAEECYKALKPFITKTTNIQVLSPQGDLHIVSEHIVEYHDANQKYDDVILESVNNFSKNYIQIKEFGKRKLTVRPVVFITNDMILRTKMMNSDITCINSKLFSRIANMIK